MAKKRSISKKDRAELRKAKREISREINKSLTKKDRADLRKFKCTVKEGAQGTGGCFYFLGFLGALIYHLNTATGFWDAAIGFLQAIVWPAFLVYDVMMFLAV